MPTTCKFENCRKRATYGFVYSKGDRCLIHKGDRKSQYSICRCGKNSALFNLPNKSRGEYCELCKDESMIKIRNHKKCICGIKYPSFNIKGDINQDVCNICSIGTDINIVNDINNICSIDTDINIINDKNNICCCGITNPIYAIKGDPSPICCNICKDENMVKIGNNKICECGIKYPRCNKKGDIAPDICKLCSICPGINLINVRNNMCRCGITYPKYAVKGETEAICCHLCKDESMVNIKRKMCKGQNGICPIGQCANPKYHNYCTTCFSHNFPNDPLTFQIRNKSKELSVRDFINSKFDGFQHDKTLYTNHCDCSVRRRIDHRKLFGNTLLAIETDENQHKSYNDMDEEIRYDDLYMAYSGKWIYIRFNPDKFLNSHGRSKNPTIASRLPILEAEINKQINRIQNNENKELVEIIYLFYDKYDTNNNCITI